MFVSEADLIIAVRKGWKGSFLPVVEDMVRTYRRHVSSGTNVLNPGDTDYYGATVAVQETHKVSFDDASHFVDCVKAMGIPFSWQFSTIPKASLTPPLPQMDTWSRPSKK